MNIKKYYSSLYFVVIDNNKYIHTYIYLKIFFTSPPRKKYIYLKTTLILEIWRPRSALEGKKKKKEKELILYTFRAGFIDVYFPFLHVWVALCLCSPD